MANKLIMRCSLEPQIDASESVDSKTYQNYQIDKHIGSHGGSITTTYSDAKAIKYVGEVDVTAAAALTDGLIAFNGTATTSGTEPGANGVKAFYVKLDSVIGTAANVTVTYEDNIHAVLTVGESCLVPFTVGALADCKIHTNAAWVLSTNVATVTVILIGD